jgi:hypothetical protein
MDHPAEATGALHAILMGAGAAIIALIIAQFFPSIIPARAAAVKL